MMKEGGAANLKPFLSTRRSGTDRSTVAKPRTSLPMLLRILDLKMATIPAQRLHSRKTMGALGVAKCQSTRHSPLFRDCSHADTACQFKCGRPLVACIVAGN